MLLVYSRFWEESVDYVVNPVPSRLSYSIPYQKNEKYMLFKTRLFHRERWALFQLVLTDNLTQSRHWRQEPGLMRIDLWTCLCKMWRAQSTTVGGTGAGGLGLDEKSGWIQVCEWTDKQRFSIVARLAFSSDRSYPESISETTSFLCRVRLVKVFHHSNRKEMGTVFNGQENFFLIGY